MVKHPLRWVKRHGPALSWQGWVADDAVLEKIRAYIQT